MPTIKLTSKGVENLKSEAGKDRTDYFDTVMPGLSLRVTKSGSKSWVVYFRSPIERDRRGLAKVKRYTVGKYPRLGVADAREEAGKVMRQVDEGSDPQREKAEAKLKQTMAVNEDPITVKDGVHRYIEEHIKVHSRPRQRADGSVYWEIQRMLEKSVLPYMGGLRLATLTRKDVLSLHRHIAKVSGPTAAERAAEGLRAVLNWLDDAELVEAVPVIRLKSKQRKEAAKRHRILTGDEIRAVWKNLSEISPFSSIVRILLLTGQRRSEVAGMRWEEVDLDTQMWSLPEERTKNKLPHMVPLSDAVIELIKDRIRVGEFVFTTTGKTAFSGFSRSKARLDGRAGFSDWTLHDLRRTFVTRLNELGILPHVVEATVNHISGAAKVGVAGIYNKAQYLPERKVALEKWAETLEEIIS